jgi:predicted nucleotidyltransferase
MTMRITEQQQQDIKRITREIMGPEAQVRLFGSRVDDARKGGDIDLYIETPRTENVLSSKAMLLRALWQALGPQRIDIVIRPYNQALKPIHQDAIEQGVLL